MRPKALRSILTVVVLMMVVLSSPLARSIQSVVTPGSENNTKPLLLEKNEGELRTRRIHTDASVPASSQFMLKAGRMGQEQH